MVTCRGTHSSRKKGERGVGGVARGSVRVEDIRVDANKDNDEGDDKDDCKKDRDDERCEDYNKPYWCPTKEGWGGLRKMERSWHWNLLPCILRTRTSRCPSMSSSRRRTARTMRKVPAHIPSPFFRVFSVKFQLNQ